MTQTMTELDAVQTAADATADPTLVRVELTALRALTEAVGVVA